MREVDLASGYASGGRARHTLNMRSSWLQYCRLEDTSLGAIEHKRTTTVELFSLCMSTPASTHANEQTRGEVCKGLDARSRVQIAEARGGQMNCPANKEICK